MSNADELLQSLSDSLFAPESLQDIRNRLSFLSASECNCDERPHENALHDLADDDVPLLLNLVDALGVPAINAAHIERQRKFSLSTFGPGDRVDGVLDHIAKELGEIRKAPTDLSEWADVIILALDGAWRSGAEPQAIIDAIVAKQAKNEARQWPDWRTQDPTKAIEHDRSVEA